MFKRIKKKLKKEGCMVDYIIQIFADQNSIDYKLLNFINEKVYREEEKRELLASLDKYNTQLYDHSIFDRFKKRLLGAKNNQPILTLIELSVCFLISTQMYYPETIIDILWIDKVRFREIVQSLEAKLAKEKHRLPKGYIAMQPLIYAYCATVKDMAINKSDL